MAESESPSQSPSPTPKRKREDVETVQSSKTKKKRKLKRQKDRADEDLDEDLSINLAIARMDNNLLSDYLAQRTKRYEPELTTVELEDRYISASLIHDTSSWERPRSLENLAEFLQSLCKDDLTAAPKDCGSPHTLLIAASGIRAADLTRSLRKFQTKESHVGKLFAKHIKFKEAVEFCKKTRMNFGVGTPQRIQDLLNDGALSLTHLKRIVVDASHIDQKKRSILEMKDTQVPLLKLLASSRVKSRLGTQKDCVRLIFY